MKKKLFSILCIFISHISVFAQTQIIIEPCKQGTNLITALRASYTPTLTLGYNRARDSMYKTLDVTSGNLTCIYTGYTAVLPATTVPDSTYRARALARNINAEHTFPQSKGAGAEPAQSDLFHLHPSRVDVNADRGNLPFAIISNAAVTNWYLLGNQQTSIPSNPSIYSRGNATVFEPRDSKKGNIARGIFYFMTIYESAVTAAGGTTFFDGMKADLLTWHYADPVDAAEWARLQKIKTWQGNDNPFVLDSSLARRAFFLPSATYTTGSASCYLPVELVFFEAKKQEENIYLTWETASETNNKGFEIEQSFDAKHWSPIGFVAAKENQYERKKYNFQWKNVLSNRQKTNTYYFRLNQIDLDQTAHLSKTVSVWVENESNSLQVYPNPAHNVLNLLSKNGELNSSNMIIFDGLGKIWQQNTTAENIDISELPTGFYWLQIENEGKIARVKFLKQ